MERLSLDPLATDAENAATIAQRVLKALNPITPQVHIVGDVVALRRALAPWGDLRDALDLFIKAALASGALTPEQLDGAQIYGGTDGKVHVNIRPARLETDDEPTFQMTQSELGFLLEDFGDAIAASQQPGAIHIQPGDVRPQIHINRE